MRSLSTKRNSSRSMAMITICRLKIGLKFATSRNFSMDGTGITMARSSTDVLSSPNRRHRQCGRFSTLLLSTPPRLVHPATPPQTSSSMPILWSHSAIPPAGSKLSQGFRSLRNLHLQDFWGMGTLSSGTLTFPALQL